MAKKKKVSPEEWERQEEIESQARALVKQHHPHLEHAAILVFMKPRAGRRGPIVNVAKAMKATPLIRAALHLGQMSAEYLVVIGNDAWAPLDWKTKEAILDHELCHFGGRDDKGRWTMMRHEVEEFVDIVKRHGAYTFSLKALAKEVKQLELPTPAGRELQAGLAGG